MVASPVLAGCIPQLFPALAGARLQEEGGGHVPDGAGPARN